MARPLLSCVEIEPEAAAQYSVLWLHGLGANGHDFEPIVPYLRLDPSVPVRFVFPHAPSRPVTINGGMVMPAWYDIYGLDTGSPQDAAGVRTSGQQVADLIAREAERGVPAERVVLAGFSQGGAIALYQGLRHPERLAGILALSTYLVLAEHLREERSDANLEVPIFMAHGTHDPMVPFARGEQSCRALRTLGYDAQWNAYPMAHEVCPQEIADIGAWLAGLLEPR